MRRPVAGSKQPVASYAAVFAGYVALGLVTRNWVLNWVVGPLFPLLVLHVVPRGLSIVFGRPRRAG